MDKVIVTVLLIIGGVVGAFAILNGVYPAIQRSSSAINAATTQVDDQIKSQIEIINVSSGGTSIQVWVKNVGMSTIGPIQNSDVFLNDGLNVQRIAWGDGNSPLPYWSYELKSSGTTWGPSTTNELTIHLAAPLAAGSYEVKVVIPNGVADQLAFGQ
jgi:archaellum component FlaG (FlaF/FlaG flagellin family)